MNKNTLLGFVIISCIGVVFAVIATDDSEENTDDKVIFAEFELDQQKVKDLQLQYDEIIKYSCMDAKPQSYFEVKMEEKILEAEHRLRYLSEQHGEIENIKNQITELNDNYSESEKESFTLYEWECVNQKFWVDEYPHLQDILDDE